MVVICHGARSPAAVGSNGPSKMRILAHRDPEGGCRSAYLELQRVPGAAS